MQLQDQVTSLEVSKKLKELGIKQESLYQWQHDPINDSGKFFLTPNFPKTGIAAFTVAELGNLLPPTLSKPYDVEFCVYDNPRRNEVCLKSYTNAVEQTHFTSGLQENEADARALALVHLLENKLIPLP